MVKSIQNGAKQYAEYLTENIPQTKGEKVKYYFSGSLAMVLLSISKNIKNLKSDSNGQVTNNFPLKEIPETARQSFENGVRPLSADIDIIEISDADFSNEQNNKVFNLSKIKENCSEWYSLCPFWHGFNGTMYVDILTNERELFSHNISIIELDNGKKILITNPVDLMFHKFSEMCMINSENSPLKYEKDCRDLSCLFNGLTKLQMIPSDPEKYLQSMTKSNHFSAVNNLLYYDYTDKIEKILKDTLPLIPQKEQNNFKKFIFSAKNFNESYTCKQMA